MFWSRKPDQQDILTKIRSVAGENVVPHLVCQGCHVLVTLTLGQPLSREAMQDLTQQVEAVLDAAKGVTSHQVILTAEQAPRENKAAMPHPVPRAVAPHVKKIIAVASGKGGVGKSTVAANLAVALAGQGARVGLLDADVYGPSVPMLMGVRHAKPVQENDYLIPVSAHGIAVMSMGFLVNEEAPMVWRGPMVQSALLQMLRDVRWGTQETPLDILVIDMPPGTGDTQLTIAQKVKLDGAVIVSTPQDVALLDTVKGIEMFRKVSVPLLGVVENMSYFCCPNCNHESPIFGQHGARQRAADLNVPFLGEIPLTMELRMASDMGMPAATQADHPAQPVFYEIAKKVMQALGEGQDTRPAPQIIIEPAA